MDSSSVPQVLDAPYSDRWNARFNDWFQERLEEQLGSAKCEPTYEEWLAEAKQTQCNGRTWVGIKTCEEQLAWCDSVSTAEAKEWYEVIANPQRTTYFGSAFTVTANNGAAVSILHRDWMGQYRYRTHEYATTLHPASGLEVPAEWAYAGMDRAAWRKAILEVYPFEMHIPSSSGPDLELHRSIYAPSELVDYEFHLGPDSVYSLVSLYGAGGSYDISIPIRTWDPDSLHAYMDKARHGSASVSIIERAAWADSARCFHMETDRIPELRPHGRFAATNRAIRQFRRSMIGSTDFCCKDNLEEGIDCQEESYHHELTRVDFEVQQNDNEIISIMLMGYQNWGGSMVARIPSVLNFSTKTGWPIHAPEALSEVDLTELASSMKREFISGNACSTNLEAWSQSPEALSTWYEASLLDEHAFVVKDGEWHWVLNGHPHHCNAGQRVWTIPTGVPFQP